MTEPSPSDPADTFRRQIPRRLDKLLRDSTRLSRASILEALAEGRVRVRVGGRDVEPEVDRVMFGDDEVRLDGVVVTPLAEQSVTLLNKPKGVTATVRDPRGRRDLSRWLAAMPAGCFPVGRLDRETTGALLFTTDGDLANAVLQPDHHTSKVYELRIAGLVTDADPRLDHFRRGVETAIGTLRADDVRVASARADETELLVTLSMGKNRQLRRMCYATNLRLRHLHRRSIGPLEVGGLARGEWRMVTDVELGRLWAAVDGRRGVWARKVAALERQASAARLQGTPMVRLERWLATQAR